MVDACQVDSDCVVPVGLLEAVLVVAASPVASLE